MLLFFPLPTDCGLQIRRNGQSFSVSLDALGGEPWWSIRESGPPAGHRFLFCSVPAAHDTGLCGGAIVFHRHCSFPFCAASVLQLAAFFTWECRLPFFISFCCCLSTLAATHKGFSAYTAVTCGTAGLEDKQWSSDCSTVVFACFFVVVNLYSISIFSHFFCPIVGIIFV